MERDSSTVKEGGFQGEGRQAKRSSPLGEVGESISGRVDAKARSGES